MALIPPIQSGVSSLTSTTPTTSLGATDATDSSSAKRGSDFGDMVSSALDTMSSQDLTADQMARDAATGKLQNVSDYMIAENQAQLTTQLTVAVRNKAVDAFNQIMGMTV
jgi:flagellar hook-basal body complex protein FliE